MIFAALTGVAALPRLIDAVESLGIVARAQMAQQRKDEKDKAVDDLIDAARNKRMLERKVERLSGDNGGKPCGVCECCRNR